MENSRLEEEYRFLQNEQMNKNQIESGSTLDTIIKRDAERYTEDNIEKEFIYRDYNGSPLYRIIKQKEGEEYVVQNFQNGVYDYGMNGTQKVPYNMPDLNNSKDKIIFITNGEDKAELIKDLGFIATTAPFSSPKKWRKEFNYYLANAKGVIILQDNKRSNIRYVSNTYTTIKEDIKNIGIVKITDLAMQLGVDLEEETTLITLKEKLNNNEKLKEMFETLVTLMEPQTSEV